MLFARLVSLISIHDGDIICRDNHGLRLSINSRRFVRLVCRSFVCFCHACIGCGLRACTYLSLRACLRSSLFLLRCVDQLCVIHVLIGHFLCRCLCILRHETGQGDCLVLIIFIRVQFEGQVPIINGFCVFEGFSCTFKQIRSSCLFCSGFRGRPFLRILLNFCTCFLCILCRRLCIAFNPIIRIGRSFCCSFNKCASARSISNCFRCTACYTCNRAFLTGHTAYTRNALRSIFSNRSGCLRTDAGIRHLIFAVRSQRNKHGGQYQRKCCDSTYESCLYGFFHEIRTSFPSYFSRFR